MNRIAIFIFSLTVSLASLAQKEKEFPGEDTILSQNLAEVVVKAYEQKEKLIQVPAAINYIDKSQFDRFSNTSILPALNATPGVRMEERSPGSYRMNIRGSTLRSPFGVRNIKIYWDGIPFTDPGGNTYLNQFGYYNLHSIEVIKGPGSSLYGAGTGGTILIQSEPESWDPGVMLNYGYGSFNLNSMNVQARLGSDDRRNSFNYTHQYSDGYRYHTSMRRDIATWQTEASIGSKQKLRASVLYGDLYYQTPGALKLEEYNSDPKAARPAAGPFPDAETAKAAIYQKTFLASITNAYQFNDHFQNTFVLYGAFSQIKNPTFRNYEKRMEPHFGGRTVFKWDRQLMNSSLQVLFGGEAQRGFFNTKTFKNKRGNTDTLLTDDDINNWIYSVFAQGDLRLSHGWIVMAGLSINRSSIEITRLSIPSSSPKKRIYSSEWAPRVAVAKKIIPGLMIYASISKGFSPPTAQEVLPSTSVISTDLEAEHGINYEAGFKSNWLNQRLYVEINAFYFQLKNTIVQRRDNSGGDYFINAGSTRQRGIETQASYQLLQHRNGFINHVSTRISHTWNDFKYRNFKQVNNDYAGKQLPGVAPHTLAAGLDVVTRPGFYTNITYYYSDPVAVNDGNISYSFPYNLLEARTGWRATVRKKITLEVFTGVNNLFDVQYSMGYDINAAGGRYYNAAPGINYYAGISLKSFR
ncbi:TonB-dependent receptor [Terrimonas alba]|uniref:TonB-dependent receptor n=1 Tax=Terrimonas alba TaxID=3349636 RepID=UPI0035F461C4